MERIYFVFWRLFFLVLFVLGFIGAAASGADHDQNGNQTESPVVSLIRDVRLAEEVNALNEGRWNQDVSNVKEDGLARVETLLEADGAAGSHADEASIIQIPSGPPDQPPGSTADYSSRAKSELAE